MRSRPTNSRPGDAANDQEKIHEVSEVRPINSEAEFDGHYYFKICRRRTSERAAASTDETEWLWRMLSPAGATMIECGGYADQERCRAAVALLQEKAGSALVSIGH